jgi:hypothetical protein
MNPAGSVRGPRHVVTVGQTPVVDPAEARAIGSECGNPDSPRLRNLFDDTPSPDHS